MMTRRQRVFLTGLAAATVFAGGLLYAWRYVAPFVLAMFFATVIDPAVGGLCRHLPIRRGVAIVIVLSLFFIGLGGVVFAVVANLGSELEQLVESLPRFAVLVRDGMDNVRHRIEELFVELPSPLADALHVGPEQWTETLQSAAKGILGGLTALPEAMFVVFVGGLATYFISKDRHELWRGLLAAIPPEWRGSVVRFRDEVVGGALGIVRAQLALIALTAIVSVLGLVLLRVPYAWALGLLAGLLDLAPFLGPSTVFLPVAAVHLLQGNSASGLGLLVVWMIVVLVRQGVEPHLFGAGLGLHPVTTLAALYVGVQAVGTAGFVAGPLFLIAIKALFVVTASGKGRGG